MMYKMFKYPIPSNTEKIISYSTVKSYKITISSNPLPRSKIVQASLTFKICFKSQHVDYMIHF